MSSTNQTSKNQSSQTTLDETAQAEPDSGGEAQQSLDSEAEEMGFGEALGEIETILADIEGDEVDIDELAQALGRAASLLELCRGKIRRAEKEVAQVSQRLSNDDD